jgi:hypothetical protein
MRRRISSKSEPCPESNGVDVAGIGVKVEAHYPGRSVRLPCARSTARCPDERSEVSRRHSRSPDQTDDPNVWKEKGAEISMLGKDAEVRSERDEAAAESRGRNPPGYVACESASTARMENSDLEELGLMEAVVGRENMRQVDSNQIWHLTEVLRNQRLIEIHQIVERRPHPVETPPRYPLRPPLENAKSHITAQSLFVRSIKIVCWDERFRVVPPRLAFSVEHQEKWDRLGRGGRRTGEWVWTAPSF